MGRLLIVSNRLPFTIDKTDEGVFVRQSSGGLVSAIKSYFDRPDKQSEAYDDKVWIGSMDASPEDWEAAAENPALTGNFQTVPIFPDKEEYDNYYNGFSNSTLWPLLHYFPTLTDFRKEYFEAYRHINQQFAQAIISAYKDRDTVWVHDYQLMLLPQMLREACPTQPLVFFLHIPFPSYEISGCCHRVGNVHFCTAYWVLI